MLLQLRFSLTLVLLTALLPLQAKADENLALGPMPISLKHLPIPETPGLLDGKDPIVVDKNIAIALGKALFWDINVGSDGMACASCHFHAGADRRIKNQLSPNGQSSPPTQEDLESFSANKTLATGDFPFHQTQNPLQENSKVATDKNVVVGSSGTFAGDYRKAVDSQSYDDCKRTPDMIFHVGKTGTRRVTPRNAPSVINAIFNHRSFWDGRANNVFNGSNSWGDRDPNAGVWVMDNNQVLKRRLHLKNSSLASLATAPPLNTTEMSCENRFLQDVGRKLLTRRPLEKQKVHGNDSVLGHMSSSDLNNLKPGLNTTYEQLIKKAFNKKYWAYKDVGKFGRPLTGRPYRQIEANFGMFFGLSIQLYASTLISDEAPFDKSRRDANNQPIDLSASELNGLKQFRINLCSNCHVGPNFTSASINANAALAKTHPEVFGQPSNKVSASTNVVSRIPIFAHDKALTVFSDTGFSATGVTQERVDIGLADTDIFGNPLSFSQQYLHYLAGNEQAVKDDDVRHVRACDFQEPFAVNYKPAFRALSLFNTEDGVRPQPQNTDDCFLEALKNAFIPTVEAAKTELANPDTNKMVAKVKNSFKVPSLRNIELTGPYMHNGGMATLEHVIEFYARGGNFTHEAKEITLVFPLPRLKFSEKSRNDLIAFLKTLTDERVRYQKAPFDHPELIMPNGHEGNQSSVTSSEAHPNLAKDEFLIIPAVGASGSDSPIQPFEYYLAEHSS